MKRDYEFDECHIEKVINNTIEFSYEGVSYDETIDLSKINVTNPVICCYRSGTAMFIDVECNLYREYCDYQFMTFTSGFMGVSITMTLMIVLYLIHNDRRAMMLSGENVPLIECSLAK